MHAEGPLLADDRALCPRQDDERLAIAVTASQNTATQSIDECGQISSDIRMPAPTTWATIKSVI